MKNLKEIIKNAPSAKIVPVEVPEWGVTLHLRELTVLDRLPLFEQAEKTKGAKLGVHVLLHTLVDEHGTLLFEAEDFDLLASKPAHVIDRLAKLAYDLNHMAAGSVDEAKKN